MSRWLVRGISIVALAGVLTTTLWAEKHSVLRPQTAAEGVDVSRFDAIPAAVERAIAEKKLPGAVVLVGRGAQVLYQKAFGRRAVEPAPEPMTIDTIFDLASLTKIVATTTSMMKLMEDGRIRMNDRVATFIPGFERYGKADITIRHLMTHTSGLRPDLDLGDSWSGYDTAITLAIEEVPTSSPGERFVYSDINYILLGDIVRRVSGQPLNEFAREHIFEPLGMKDTMFLPAESLRPRIAPTEQCTPFGWPCEGSNLQMLRGRRARSDGAPDGRRGGSRRIIRDRCGRLDLLPDAARRRHLQRHAHPLAADGGQNDARAPTAVADAGSDGTSTRPTRRTAASFCRSDRSVIPASPARASGSIRRRGCTWSSCRTACIPTEKETSRRFARKSPRLPRRRSTVVPRTLRTQRFTIDGAESGWIGRRPRATAPVQTGIDVLRAQKVRAAARQARRPRHEPHGPSARRRDDDRSAVRGERREAGDALQPGTRHPRHPRRQRAVTQDEKTKLPILSLYGDTRRPTDAMLEGLDAIVIDLQDIGARFYTYMTTMAYVMEEAAKRKLPVFVLDRPESGQRLADRGTGARSRTPRAFTGYFRRCRSATA